MEQYYDLEENEVYKSEFHEGEIFAMAGGSPEHSLIVMNMLGELGQRLKGKACTPCDSNLRIKVPATKCLGIKLPLAEVYDRVKFGKQKS